MTKDELNELLLVERFTPYPGLRAETCARREHVLDDVNLYVDSRGGRHCRACNREDATYKRRRGERRLRAVS